MQPVTGFHVASVHSIADGMPVNLQPRSSFDHSDRPIAPIKNKGIFKSPAPARHAAAIPGLRLSESGRVGPDTRQKSAGRATGSVVEPAKCVKVWVFSTLRRHPVRAAIGATYVGAANPALRHWARSPRKERPQAYWQTRPRARGAPPETGLRNSINSILSGS